MKLFLQILFLLFTWFTNLANATPVLTKVTLPNYEFTFSKTDNAKEESVLKIKENNFARNSIETNSFQKLHFTFHKNEVIFSAANERENACVVNFQNSVKANTIAIKSKSKNLNLWRSTACLEDDRFVNTAGSVLRKIDDFIPSSGTQLIANSNKTTTLLGRWSPDMQVIKGKMLPNEFNVGTEFGTVTSNNGAFNFLNIPDNLANAAGSNFFNLYNKPWLQQAIHRGDDIVLATRPTLKANFIDPITGNLLGMYAEELKFLVQQNYKPVNLSANEWSTIKTWFP